MNCNVSSVLWFLLLYFLLHLVMYILDLLENIFNVLSAYFTVKFVELQSKIEPEEEEKEKDLNCIGFQISDSEEEDDNE